MGSALEQRLKRHGLLPSTRNKYYEILNGADRSDIVGWINGKVHARTPIGTILPMRAAVKHYLVAELGYTEEEVQNLLPKAKGRPAKNREALSPHQLAVYHSAVEEVDKATIKTILFLLPSTGLRIGEATSLHVNDIRTYNARVCLAFRGKRDKERMIPLTLAAEREIKSYLNLYQPASWLFPSFTQRPLTPHAVRKYTRKIAEDYPELCGLSPHILRHTFATMALRKGVDLKNLQTLMGHESIQTTSRYLHPTISDLQQAVDRLDG